MGSLYNKQTHNIVGKSLDDEIMDEVVRVYSHGCMSDEMVMKGSSEKRVHSQSMHNYWDDMGVSCLYCTGGSVVLRDDEFEDFIQKKTRRKQL